MSDVCGVERDNKERLAARVLVVFEERLAMPAASHIPPEIKLNNYHNPKHCDIITTRSGLGIAWMLKLVKAPAALQSLVCRSVDSEPG